MKNVNIVAKGKGWEAAPYEHMDNWGVNDVCLRHPVSMIFHMHKLDEFIERPNEKSVLEAIFKKSEEEDIPIVTLDNYSFVPNCVKYPFDDIIKKFKTTYFGSSLDFMLAYAIYEGTDEINMYGINMVLQNEYRHQKPSLEYWIAFARGRGIKVNLHGSDEFINICQTFNEMIYGYDIMQFNVNGEL